MSARLDRIDDPRDALARARRPELVEFARQNNVTEIDPEMPAILMVKILRSKGLTNIGIPRRFLGFPEGPVNAALVGHAGMVPAQTGADAGQVIDAEEDLMRQFEQQKALPKPKPKYEMAEIRKECKRRGIKTARTAKMADLKALLNG